MKAAGILFGLSSIFFSFGSCSSYYYSTLSSNDEIGMKNDDNDFIQESDSVLVSYCFYGENAPVSITIYNKMDEPLFIDWQCSALIIEDVATSYYQDEASIRMRTESVTTGETFSWSKSYSSTGGTTSGSASGEISIPRGVSFIPPKSKITSTPLTLANFPFDRIPKEAYTKRKLATVGSEVVSVRVKKFTEEDSPLFFRSYLTLYTGGLAGQHTRQWVLERSFYIGELIKTGNLPPQNFQAGAQEAGDFFYVHKVKGANAGIIIGAIAVGTASIVLESALSPTYYYNY